MKAEKNKKITTEEALKKVQEVMKRIDNEKETLRSEYDGVCKEIERRAKGKPSIRLSKGGFIKTSEYYMSDEELANRKYKLKTALEIPYYADEEFREHSLVYLELVTEEANEQYDDLTKRREENYEKLLEYRRGIEKLGREHREIGGETAMKYISIGLGKFARGLINGACYSNFINYKRFCENYED